MSTNVSQFIGELDAGQLERQMSNVLSEVAGSVTDHDRAGKVVITLDIKKIKNSAQVNIDHTIKYSRPTSAGTKTEDFKRSTPMYVGTKGAMSFFPEKQTAMFDIDGVLNSED